MGKIVNIGTICSRGASRTGLLLLSIVVFLTCGFLPAECRGDLVDLIQIPDDLVPHRDIAMNGDRDVAWKKAWDQARYLVRTGDYRTAEKKYEELFDLKGDIDQAKWEYARLLIKTEQWEKSSVVLENLTEKNPDRVDYLTCLGLVSRKSGKLGRALDLFRKAYEKDPGDLTALAGLVQGLVEVGRKKEAFPLLEKVFARRSDDVAIRHALAILAFELGNMERAAALMRPLAEAKGADLDTLLMTARIYEEFKNSKQAAVYWERCLEVAPDNREAHGRLALYYEKSGKADGALTHLLALLTNDPENSTLLSRICRIFIRNDRFAEALPYFERYVALRPDDPGGVIPVGSAERDAGEGDMISLYRRLLAVTPDDLELLDELADDLLKVGDAETALFMWEHVARLHPGRIDVYREIVDLLESLGRGERLAEILEVIHRLAPGEVKVVGRLANLKVAQGDLLTGLDYFNKLEKAGYQGADLFEGRGRLFEKLGRSASALADYKSLLKLMPDRFDIRQRCVNLAAELGKDRLLSEEIALIEAPEEPENKNRDLLLAANAFAKTRHFEGASERYRMVIASLEGPETDPPGENLAPLVLEAKFGLADLYLEEGMTFKAEQILREIFLTEEVQAEVLLRLFDMALSPDELQVDKAGIWYERYASLESDPGKIKLMRARLLTAAGFYRQAEDLLKKILYEIDKTVQQSLDVEEFKKRAGLLLAGNYLSAGELDKAEQQLILMLGGRDEREVKVLLGKIYLMTGRAAAAVEISGQLLNDEADSHDFLDLARLYKAYGMPEECVAAAGKALEREPESLAAAYLSVWGLAVQDRFGEAIGILSDKAVTYPGESWIILRMVQYYYLNGQYASALQQCERFLERNPDRLDAHYLKMLCVKALGDELYAEKTIRSLFEVGTEEILMDKAASAGIKLSRPQAERTFLEMLTFSEPNQPSVIKEIMAAGHLVDNSSPQKKKLNFIAAGLYERYRWEMLFRGRDTGE